MFGKLFGKKDFIELPTVKGYPVLVRKSAIIRVWNDEGVTAVMYSSSGVDHIKLPLKEVVKRIEK